MQVLKAVTADAFAGKSWKHPGNYLYAAGLNIIPVVAAELSKAVAHLPLAFVEFGGRWQLMAVTSLIPNTNLLVGPQGQWLGQYIPASMRGYPFALARPQGTDHLVMCTTEEGDHIVEAGQGAPFFDASGQPSAETQRAMNFLVEYDSSKVQTWRAIDALVAAKLLVPWELTSSHNGVVTPVEGLYRLDDVRFGALPPKTLASLHAEGAAMVAYAQYFSREQFGRLQAAEREQARLRALTAAPDA
ncbi:MAG: SapC family protein [Curvibacter lanceolatus]|jgi:hypothetical protein|uniref:SapC family protein n=1 Tax=Curvibacter lanceolatus TaxID=86182 RepID=UPI00035EF4D7|nr:SapC family protein [Curvibacter lanceolatus]MBV5292215.1 SapC family protein [Curvibacter lanceolatus]